MDNVWMGNDILTWVDSTHFASNSNGALGYTAHMFSFSGFRSINQQVVRPIFIVVKYGVYHGVETCFGACSFFGHVALTAFSVGPGSSLLRLPRFLCSGV